MKMSLTSAHQLQREVNPLLSSVRLSLLAVFLSGAMGAASCIDSAGCRSSPRIGAALASAAMIAAVAGSAIGVAGGLR